MPAPHTSIMGMSATKVHTPEKDNQPEEVTADRQQAPTDKRSRVFAKTTCRVHGEEPGEPADDADPQRAHLPFDPRGSMVSGRQA